MTMEGRVSDKSWAEKTGLMKGLHHQAAAALPLRPPASGPELVKSDTPVIDAFEDPTTYEAVRALHARSNDAYFFVPGRAAPYVRPYAYFQGVDPIPDGTGLLVHWPGLRFEVRGDNLLPAISRLSQRRADVWRVFRPGYHVAPLGGATVIRDIRAVLDSEAAGPR